MADNEKSRMVRLKNGAEEHSGIVGNTLLKLQDLMRKGNEALVYTLVQLCNDPEQELWYISFDKLKALCLIGADGKVHESIKNVVLSAVVGEGMDLSIGDPIEKDEDYDGN